MVMTDSVRGARHTTITGLSQAVHHSKAMSREGILERLFTLAFRGLVYPQIWEDPVVDMEALALQPTDRIITIASGGCNALSYLTADPERIVAVDLNGAHVALLKLKLAALKRLPDHRSFRRFFGAANAAENITVYDALLRRSLDPVTRGYWNSRTLTGRRRIGMFGRNFFRYGLLGRFIGAVHFLARLHGVNPAVILQAKSREEQQALFDQHFAPIFEKPFVRWLLAQPASLYGLGIPPAQYRELAAESNAGAASVVRSRLQRLTCGFELADNYFAWQALGRTYAPGESASVPPYLEKANFEALRLRADRVTAVQASMTDILRGASAASYSAYVLLDAQDWMNRDELTALWSEITRTARPGARVIFRTAAVRRLLPGMIPDALLDAWTYEEARSRDYGERDRSAIYGAFHLYTLKGAQS